MKRRWIKCKNCGTRVWWDQYPSTRIRQFCNPHCNIQYQNNLTRKVPLDKDLLTELYVKRRMTFKAMSEYFDNPGVLGIYLALRKLHIWRPEKRQSNNPTQDVEKVVSLYRHGLTAKQIALKFPCSESHIYRLLDKGGVKRKKGIREAVTCKETGCSNPVWKFVAHGVSTGTRCKAHQSKYWADLQRRAYRMKRGWKLDNTVCDDPNCSKPRWQDGPRWRRKCKFHFKLERAKKARTRHRLLANVPQEKWKVLDADSCV